MSDIAWELFDWSHPFPFTEYEAEHDGYKLKVEPTWGGWKATVKRGRIQVQADEFDDADSAKAWLANVLPSLRGIGGDT
jgi:hypothetical protein